MSGRPSHGSFSVMDLAEQLKAERLVTYRRLRGGAPIPVAGMIYWAALAYGGVINPDRDRWILIAFITSGMIFPAALLLSKLARIDFMGDRSALSSVTMPALVSAVLFWPTAFAARTLAPDLVPLILAIGMSVHWPIIGWTYGRAGLYTGHAVARAVVCGVIFAALPEGRFTLLPLAVAVIYALTVAAILIDLSRPAAARAA